MTRVQRKKLLEAYNAYAGREFNWKPLKRLPRLLTMSDCKYMGHNILIYLQTTDFVFQEYIDSNLETVLTLDYGENVDDVIDDIREHLTHRMITDECRNIIEGM